MRPAPREPSKQLKAKSLPATKRRATSGLIGSACAAPVTSRVKATIAKRAIIPIPPSQYGSLPHADNRLLTMRIGRDHARAWSTNRLPDLHHDSTPNLAVDDARGRLDHAGEPDFCRHFSQLSPIEVAFEAFPRHLPIGDRTHH